MARSSRVFTGVFRPVNILPPRWSSSVRSVRSTRRTPSRPSIAASTSCQSSWREKSTVSWRTVWRSACSRMSTAPICPPAAPMAAATDGSRPGGRREVFLIDGNSLAYRAFFALPETIATSRGFPTNAIFGFASMLVKILDEHGQQPTLVVWDAGMSGREQVYEPYKAQRVSRPDLLADQFPHLAPLVEAFGYRNIKVPGYEADDVIATLAARGSTEGVEITIVTGDRDALQLVEPGVRVMATSRGITDTKMYDREAVIERYGIAPELIPDFYGLKGDTSDNIPGVPGIGDKTASQLLQRFGDLEGVLSNVENISGAKRKQNLTEHADDARVSKELATAV